MANDYDFLFLDHFIGAKYVLIKIGTKPRALSLPPKEIADDPGRCTSSKTLRPGALFTK